MTADELAKLNAALDLAETLIPKLADAVKTGDVTPEEQAEVHRRYQSLKARAEGQFTGPEWEVAKSSDIPTAGG